MVLGDSQAAVELAVAEVEPAVPPFSRGGDVLVVARVRCLGFAGETDAWIVRPAWDAFARDLVELERRRHGEAVVESISPGELRLRVFATDRAGHMAVEGYVAVRGVRHELRLEFSPIAFDPTQLPGLVAELTSAVTAGFRQP